VNAAAETPRAQDRRTSSIKEVNMDDKDVVAALLANLADKVGHERLDLWLGAQSRLTLDRDALLVELPSRFAQDWVRSHFRREMEAAAGEVIGRPVKLEFRVDAGLAVNGRTACDPHQPIVNGGHGHNGTAPFTAVVELPAENRPSLPNAIVDGCPSAGRSTTSDRLLGLRRPFAALDGFVVGESNQLAFAAAQTAAGQPGRYSPLLIYGPTGVGKTHLLEGIWTAAHRRDPRIKAVYLTAEQFTTHYVEALKGKGLPLFRQKHRGVDLFLLDDVHFFDGRSATATMGELLVTVDALLRKGSQLVLTADRPPAALRELNSQFVGRLVAGMSCEINRPEFQTRLGILRTFATRIGLELADDVAEFIATHLTSHARELSGALNRLDAASRIARQPITRAMAEEALVDLIRHNAPAVRLADIDKAVCNVFGLQSETLQSNRRAKTVSQPRMLAMWLARKHTSAALTEIGQHFGRRSHSTVISAQKAVSNLVAQQGKIEMPGKSCGIEDAIRRVEEQLRTA
jgi:chromosomal replication initiator protein